MLKDLSNPKLIWLKAGLFLLIGLISASTLLLETPTLRTAFLIVMAIWAFCRAYYFVFYVVEHYVDPGYRFSGLISFTIYMAKKLRP